MGFILESYLNEFTINNHISNTYKNTKKINLSKFKKIQINKKNIKIYKKRCAGLSHVRTSNEYIGYIWIDDINDVVCYISINKDNGIIQALEVSNNYKGNGLCNQ